MDMRTTVVTMCMLCTGLAQVSYSETSVYDVCPFPQISTFCNPHKTKDKFCNGDQYCYIYGDVLHHELNRCDSCNELCNPQNFFYPDEEKRCKEKCAVHLHKKCLDKLDNSYLLVNKTSEGDQQNFDSCDEKCPDDLSTCSMWKLVAIIFIVVTIVQCIILIVMVSVYCKKWKKPKQTAVSDDGQRVSAGAGGIVRYEGNHVGVIEPNHVMNHSSLSTSTDRQTISSDPPPYYPSNVVEVHRNPSASVEPVPEAQRILRLGPQTVLAYHHSQANGSTSAAATRISHATDPQYPKTHPPSDPIVLPVERETTPKSALESTPQNVMESSYSESNPLLGLNGPEHYQQPASAQPSYITPVQPSLPNYSTGVQVNLISDGGASQDQNRFTNIDPAHQEDDCFVPTRDPIPVADQENYDGENLECLALSRSHSYRSPQHQLDL